MGLSRTNRDVPRVDAAAQVPVPCVDIPSKSGDHKKLHSLWSKIRDEDAASKVGNWIKDRYFHKFGVHIKNMDKAIPALSDIELNGLLTFCRALDYSVLEVPYYQVQ